MFEMDANLYHLWGYFADQLFTDVNLRRAVSTVCCFDWPLLQDNSTENQFRAQIIRPPITKQKSLRIFVISYRTNNKQMFCVRPRRYFYTLPIVCNLLLHKIGHCGVVVIWICLKINIHVIIKLLISIIQVIWNQLIRSFYG